MLALTTEPVVARDRPSARRLTTYAIAPVSASATMPSPTPAPASAVSCRCAMFRKITGGSSP
jgi:hypothetical protein